MPLRRSMLAVLCLALWTGAAGIGMPAAAQTSETPTNLEVLQSLSVGCLAETVPDSMRTLRLDAPEQMAYLRTALVGRWQDTGREIYVAADSATTPLPTLDYAIETVDVTYERGGRRTVERTVTLALHYTLTTADGRLLRDARCRDAHTDTVRRDRLAALESAAHPETQADPPPGGWLRRYAQPAVVAAATVVTVFLFFSLRSDRVDN
ncbi:MAG: hypothetical protein GVY18_01660 [Bacteroidetes bacterium]|nr:hypothetical protein [Bacteroidota bacterium]